MAFKRVRRTNMNVYFHSFSEEQIELINRYNKEGIAIDWKAFPSVIKPKQ